MHHCLLWTHHIGVSTASQHFCKGMVHFSNVEDWSSSHQTKGEPLAPHVAPIWKISSPYFHLHLNGWIKILGWIIVNQHPTIFIPQDNGCTNVSIGLLNESEIMCLLSYCTTISHRKLIISLGPCICLVFILLELKLFKHVQISMHLICMCTRGI